MKKLEKLVLNFLEERGWDKPIPANLAKSIMIEGAELLEHFQWDHSTLEEVKNDKAKISNIQEEIADVLIYTIELSGLLGIDTEKTVKQKIASLKRKYPAKLMKNMMHGKVTETEYWKIKKQYRRERLSK